MPRLLFAIPGDISARSGGYGYARRVLAALPKCGIEAVHIALPGAFPNPTPADVAASVATMNGAAQAGDVLLIDGLAYGALPESAARALAAPIVALCHHPLCLETGLTDERREALRTSEARALALVRRIIVTSAHTRETLVSDFGAPRAKITVALPGIDRFPRARGSGGGALALLAVGALIPRKAFGMLVEALVGVRDGWRLRIAGPAPHAPTRSALVELIARRGLGDRVELLGETDDEGINLLFDASDVFVSSSLYEGYGMALAEALAHGLPVVMTTGGAAAETVPDTAALKVAPGDVEALRDALRRIIADDELRAGLAEESWRAGQELPRWEDAAQAIARVAHEIF
jgi:glycosyltransferase involved in cell wall biosynthesis